MHIYPIVDLREYTDTHQKLLTHLDNNWPKNHSRIIAIDGLDGVGKTTIAHFLAWQLGIAAISTDLFLSSRPNPKLKYRDEEIRKTLVARNELQRVTIIEGVFILKLLERIGYQAEYLIKIEKRNHSTGLFNDKELEAYYSEYEEKHPPDYNFRWESKKRPLTPEGFESWV